MVMKLTQGVLCSTTRRLSSTGCVRGIGGCETTTSGVRPRDGTSIIRLSYSVNDSVYSWSRPTVMSKFCRFTAAADANGAMRDSRRVAEYIVDERVKHQGLIARRFEMDCG